MKKIVYVHGANASPASFNYLKDRLPDHEGYDLSYSTSNPARQTVSDLCRMIEEIGEPVSLIGHSLGGLLAVLAAKKGAAVDRIVTLSSPFGGSRLASLLRWTHPCQLWNDIHPHSSFILDVNAGDIEIPILSIVTTSGHQTFIPEPNDGVVTVASQKCLYEPFYVEVCLNHFEVLLSTRTATMITNFLLEDE